MSLDLESEILSLIEEGKLDKNRISDVEYVLSVLKYELEMRFAVGEFFWNRCARMMVYVLLREEKIDRSRLDDAQYIKSIIWENLENLINDDNDVIIRYKGLFIPYAREVFTAGGIEAAIILAVTEIEHSLNYFYRYALSTELEDDMITQVIRSNMQAKTGWLLSLVSGKTLPTEIKAKVNQLVELRNAIVHYKFKYKSFKKIEFRPLPQIAETDIEEVIATVEELENTLEEIREQMDSDYKLSKEIAINTLGIPESEVLVDH